MWFNVCDHTSEYKSEFKEYVYEIITALKVKLQTFPSVKVKNAVILYNHISKPLSSLVKLVQ